MSYDYSGLRGTAGSLIAKYGVEAVLHRAGGLDESTYPVTRLPGTQEACKVVRDQFSSMERAGGLIADGDVKLLIAGTATPPTTADKIEVDGVTYSLQSVDAIQPGADPLVYVVRGRV